VGYGDFSLTTPVEYYLCLFWMIVGVNIYSATIGNVTSIISNLDAKAAVLNSKLSILSDYSNKFNLPKETEIRIKSYFEKQVSSGLADGEWDNLFNELPPSLRTDIINQTHGQIIKGIRFFKDKP
jgi:hypothetical protein